jgi:hypothetical protein
MNSDVTKVSLQFDAANFWFAWSSAGSAKLPDSEAEGEAAPIRSRQWPFKPNVVVGQGIGCLVFGRCNHFNVAG